jgi:antitoxin (DNA-binding transcriptional repressor) of toxin-antitoxin stability system
MGNQQVGERVTIVTHCGTMFGMKTVTIRDFRTRPRQVREALRGEQMAVLTANGRPVAVMVPVEADSVDATLDLLRRARGLEALATIQRASKGRGLDRMSPTAIDDVIARVRRRRAAGRRSR